MSLRADIQEAQKQAMKAGQPETLAVLRMVWAAIRNEEINTQKELTDDDVISVIARQVKQLQEANLDFEKGGRADLVEKNKQEIALMMPYLPAQLSDEELQATVERVIAGGSFAGAKDVGRVMGLVMKEVGKRADGGRVRTIATKVLGS